MKKASHSWLAFFIDFCSTEDKIKYLVKLADVDPQKDRLVDVSGRPFG
jgi:hypothetical protein